jgi:hypothetical protein
LLLLELKIVAIDLSGQTIADRRYDDARLC